MATYSKNADFFKFPQICRLEASAGSGKTHALAKRYIQLIMSPGLKPGEIPLNTLLAITFTNKAALEMKERILEFLKKIALDKFSSRQEKEDIMSSLRLPEELARKKAYMAMDELIRNYNFFQVQTIDSFINALLSACAFKLDLSANFKTERDYSEYLAYSLDKLIDKAADDKDIFGLIHAFLKQYLYLENKTGWFPKQDIFSIIASLFSKSNKYAAKFIRNDIEPKDLIPRKKNILELLNELQKNIPAGANKAFLKSLSAFLGQNKDSFDIDGLSDFFKREGFPINKGNDLPEDTKKLWKKIRKEIGRLCELASVCAYNYYIDIFNYILDELKSIATKDDVLFLEALNKQARALFDEKSLSLPELYYRLSARFKHFLIDEFQDTSALQWRNLFPLIEEALATDGSLFYVGDKKQAIYRFRGGEVSLIDSVKSLFHSPNLIEGFLTSNYRSAKEIVEFNNHIFSRENLRRFLKETEAAKKSGSEFNPSDTDEIIKVYEYSRQSHLRGKDGGYVKTEFLDYKTKEERAAALKGKVLCLIEDLRGRFALKDIALLARKNEEVQLFTSWLLEKDIPVESEKTLDIRQNPYIKELISFLKFLNSPIDDLSFASFILGDIFSKAAKIDSRKMHDFIFGLNTKNKDAVYLYRQFRLRFPGVWEELIEEFFKSAGFVPLYELAVSITGKFNVINNFYSYQGFFMKFLELVKEQEDDHASIGSFLEFFDNALDDDLYVNVTESDSVKILTVHKSKGLEFPAVIIPFLEMDIKVDSALIVPDADSLKLVHLKKKYADFSAPLAQAYKEEYKKSFIDELNNIYVAMTRCRDELYVFVCARGERGFNPASLLLPENNSQRGEKTQGKKYNPPDESPVIEIPPSEYSDWLHLLKDEFIEEGILQLREKVIRGEVLHCILSFIGNLHNGDKDSILSIALEKTRRRYPFMRDFKEFELTIGRLLEKKELMPYFMVLAGEVYTEKEIIDIYGNTARIDRLIITQEEARIIDYKSTGGNKGDYEQVLGYMKIIKDIYPGRQIKGVLIYLDDLSAQEVGG